MVKKGGFIAIMGEKWTSEKIKHLVENKVQESLNLEYKAADALSNANEISKDVSAMANSDGGVIIYGLKEKGVENEGSFAEAIDPIKPKKSSKERLEQIINDNIYPKIDNIIITPVLIENDKVIYVVEIPKSDTAHQAHDKRYHKRYNFTIQAMYDYEIRDVMGRSKNPKFELSFHIEILTFSYKDGVETVSALNNTMHFKDIIKEEKKFTLFITAKNISSVYANYINAFILIPYHLVDNDYIDEGDIIEEDGIKYYRALQKNTVRDVIDTQFILTQTIAKYGPARYEPILPGLSTIWEIPLDNSAELLQLERFVNNEFIKWTIYADNASPCIGEKYLSDIVFSHKRQE